MINFGHFKQFDRIKKLDPYEQQRQYWIFRNDALNPVFTRAGGANSSGGAVRRKMATNVPSSFSFFTLANQQFVTTPSDILVKTTTGYAKAFYPYDIPVGPFGSGDENLNISINFTDTTFWNGLLPFKIFSCDVDGNLSGDITYVKFDNLTILKSIDFTPSKDDLVQIDLAGCTDLQSLTIPSSISLTNLNISNTNVLELNINGCDALEVLDFQSTLFKSVYNLDLSGIPTLKTIIGDNCNLFGLITSASTLEEISLNDCSLLSSLVCTNFSGNGGLGRVQIKNCSIGPGGLDTFYTSLGTANGSNNTIYVYGNVGVGSSNPTIATNKGFTVDVNP